MFFITNEDKLSKRERSGLSDSDFGIPEDRAYPMPDAEHVRKAVAFFKHAPSSKKKALARRIFAKAKKFGVEIGPDSEVSKFLKK